jgi:hypothetical protein
MLHRAGDIQVLFEHSSQRGLGKDIYLLILFSTLLIDYVSSLLFQIVFSLKKSRTSFILIYDYLYITSHVNLWLKFCPDSIKFSNSATVHWYNHNLNMYESVIVFLFLQ